MTDPRWELPGARRFAEDLAGALSSQSQLLIAAPAGLDIGALRRSVRDRTPALIWISGEIGGLGEGAPLDAILRWLDVRTSSTRAPDESDLAEAIELADHVVWLDGYALLPPARKEEWRGFLARYARASRRDGDHNPPLFAFSVLAPTAADLDLADPAIRLSYWWGALTRLDLAIYLDAVAPEMPALERAVAVEVAGFDLDLADRLAEGRGLDLAGIEALVSGYAAERDIAPLEPDATAGPCRVGGPGTSLGPWGAGQVDRFDRQSRLFANSAACGADIRSSVLRQRVWRGQITTLLPELEIWRADLIALARVRGYLTPGAATDSLDFRELHAHLKRRRDDPARRKLADLAGDLRWARNRLAHLDHLPATTVVKLRVDAARALDQR